MHNSPNHKLLIVLSMCMCSVYLLMYLFIYYCIYGYRLSSGLKQAMSTLISQTLKYHSLNRIDQLKMNKFSFLLFLLPLSGDNQRNPLYTCNEPIAVLFFSFFQLKICTDQCVDLIGFIRLCGG